MSPVLLNQTLATHSACWVVPLDEALLKYTVSFFGAMPLCNLVSTCYCLGGNLKLRGDISPPKGPEKITAHERQENCTLVPPLLGRDYLREVYSDGGEGDSHGKSMEEGMRV